LDIRSRNSRGDGDDVRDFVVTAQTFPASEPPSVFEDMEGHVFPRARAIEPALKKTKKRKHRVHRVLTRPSFA
jgi:hypothetical protein